MSIHTVNVIGTAVALYVPPAPVSAPAPLVLSLEVGAVKYKSIRHAADVLAARTGENAKLVYGRVYQRIRAGYTLAEAMSTKAQKKGKKGVEIEYNGKTYASLLDTVKAYYRVSHPFKKVDPAVVAVLYSRTNTRMKSGMSFIDAVSSGDLRGHANGKETIVNGVTYASLMEAIRANVPYLTAENENSTYIRFTMGIKAGKTFETILATPVRVYNRKAPTAKEVMADSYEDMTVLYENAFADEEIDA